MVVSRVREMLHDYFLAVSHLALAVVYNLVDVVHFDVLTDWTLFILQMRQLT